AAPKHRIIHLRDWHYDLPELFAAEVRHAAGGPLSDQEVEALHLEQVLEAEMVQLEQASLLRCLVKHHGLRRVLVEGLTPKGLPTYREVIAAFCDTDQQLAGLKAQRAELKAKVLSIDRDIDEMIREHRRQLLDYGASGGLVVAGEIEVLPLDDENLLASAKPISPDGKVRVELATLEARHGAQVKAALA